MVDVEFRLGYGQLTATADVRGSDPETYGSRFPAALDAMRSVIGNAGGIHSEKRLTVTWSACLQTVR